MSLPNRMRNRQDAAEPVSEIDWAGIREERIGDFTLAALPPTLKLPALPHAVQLFMKKSDDPNVTFKTLARIIETDTGLTLELLRYVNSAFLGLRHKAHNVQQALALLGRRQSRTFILTTGMQSALRARKSKLINQNAFWNTNLQKALFAREVAGLLETDTTLSFAGALLQDYLLPVLSDDLFEKYVRFVQHRRRQPECLCEFERNVFGWDHAVASACLARRWHLPDELVCCVLLHHSGTEILKDPQLGRSPVAAVALSALLPDQLRQHSHGLRRLASLQQEWPDFNLAHLAANVDANQEQLGLGVHNDYPLLRHCQNLEPRVRA